jgi:hypothetical protein
MAAACPTCRCLRLRGLHRCQPSSYSRRPGRREGSHLPLPRSLLRRCRRPALRRQMLAGLLQGYLRAAATARHGGGSFSGCAAGRGPSRPPCSCSKSWRRAWGHLRRGDGDGRRHYCRNYAAARRRRWWQHWQRRGGDWMTRCGGRRRRAAAGWAWMLDGRHCSAAARHATTVYPAAAGLPASPRPVCTVCFKLFLARRSRFLADRFSFWLIHTIRPAAASGLSNGAFPERHV